MSSLCDSGIGGKQVCKSTPIKSSHSTLPIPIWMILIGKGIHCSASFCCGKEKQSCLSVIHGTDTVEWQAYLSVQASQASPSVCQTSYAATLQNAAHCTLPVIPWNALPRLACAVSRGLSMSHCAIISAGEAQSQVWRITLVDIWRPPPAAMATSKYG